MAASTTSISGATSAWSTPSSRRARRCCGSTVRRTSTAGGTRPGGAARSTRNLRERRLMDARSHRRGRTGRRRGAAAPRRVAFVAAAAGHHAVPDQGMGFCLLNNVAIAAASWSPKASGADRGLDVHHGNGTQAMFWTSPRSSTSRRTSALFPDRGAARGGALMRPASTSTSRSRPGPLVSARKGARRAAAPVIESFNPTWCCLGGFDAHRADPWPSWR